MILGISFPLHAWVARALFIQTCMLLVFLLKAQELFMAGFGSLLAMTASLYTRYKLSVSSIHRQSEATPSTKQRRLRMF